MIWIIPAAFFFVAGDDRSLLGRLPVAGEVDRRLVGRSISDWRAGSWDGG